MQWGLNGLSKLKRHISSILVDRYFQDLGEALAIIWIRFNGQNFFLEIRGLGKIRGEIDKTEAK